MPLPAFGLNASVRVLLFMLAFVLVNASIAWSAADVGDYQLDLNSDPGIVMGDSSVILSWTLSNISAPSGDTIGWFRLYVDASNYYVSQSNTAPAGWTITEIKNAGIGQSYATYEALPGSELALGDSLAVDLVVTGANDGPFPTGAADVTDSLESATVQVSSNPNADFFTGTLPTWTRYGLKTTMTAIPTSVGVGEPITVAMVVTNRTTVSQANISSGILSVTSPNGGSAAYATGPSPVSATILSGEQQSFSYAYSAVSAGIVFFSGSASNAGIPFVSSPSNISNGVSIGDFTANVSMDPVRIISSQQVTVTMTLTNNGSSHITGITPGIITSGTATLVLVSGPTPAGIANLPPGKSSSVQWIYSATGNVGDTYQFTVWGDNGTQSSSQANTELGRIFAYSATVTPDTVTSGITNLTLAFVASNAGGDPVRQVSINSPAGWTYQGATPPVGWTVASSGNPIVVTFKTTTDYIPTGFSRTFSLTFTSVPVVTNPTEYNFLVGFWDLTTKLNDPPTGSVETIVTVLPYQVVLAAGVGAGFPTPPIADGLQYYDLTATVTDGSGPVAGALVQFTTTLGSLGTATVITDINGQAFNTLTGPLSLTPVVSTVTVDYLGATDSALLNFDPYSGLALDYIPGSLSPTRVVRGDAASFTVQVINADIAPVTLSTATTFSFSDTPAGVSLYTANLAVSAPTTIAAGQTATLTFQTATVPVIFVPGFYDPDLYLTDGSRSGTRSVTDQVRVLGEATLLVTKSVNTVSDPVNGTVNPKAIPGGVVEYTVGITNIGQGPAAPDSVTVQEAVTSNTEMYVGDLDGTGSPVRFTDGGVSSNLTYSFGGLGNGGDDIAFSSESGPAPAFTYTPVPNANGFDPNVTRFRVNPKGTMPESNGINDPGFTLQFRVRVK